MQTRVPWPPRLARLCPAPRLNQEAEEEVVLAKEKAGPCAVCRYSSSWSWPRLRPSKEALCVQTLASCHGWDGSEVCSTLSLRGSPWDHLRCPQQQPAHKFVSVDSAPSLVLVPGSFTVLPGITSHINYLDPEVESGTGF